MDESITTRCGLMFGLGMRLPRKSRVNTRTLHARVLCVLCDWILRSVLACLVVHNMNCKCYVIGIFMNDMLG